MDRPDPFVRYFLFGRFHVALGVREAPVGFARKTAELLAYLLVHRDRAVRRETVASDLWGETRTATSLRRLRQELWRIHATSPESWTSIRIDDELMRWDATGAWIDVDRFERAFVRTYDRSGFDLSDAEAARLAEAAALYVGDLLAGWLVDWCVPERERLRSVYLSMLDKLMDHAAKRHRPEVGLAFGRASLDVDGAREATYQRMMRLQYEAGDRTSALRWYERCARALLHEFGVRPGRRTEAFREAIEADADVPAEAPAFGRTDAFGPTDDLERRHALSRISRDGFEPVADAERRAEDGS